MNDLSNANHFEKVVLDLTNSLERIWVKNLKIVNITRHSKSWWDMNCSRDLEKYRLTKSLENWKQFKKMESTKHLFFNLKIQEISNQRGGLWELINWVNKHKLPAVKAIKYNS